MSSPSSDRIEEIAVDVEEERDRLEVGSLPASDVEEPSSRQEWTAYAYAKLGAAAEDLRRAAEASGGEAGEAADAGRAELADLVEDLPEGRAVSSEERVAKGDPSLVGRVEEMVADLDAALDLDEG